MSDPVRTDSGDRDATAVIPSAAAPETLDPTLLARVEGMHRGNLYQHLYATACVFLAPGAGVRLLRVDVDEDIELVLDATHRYIQVKTRAKPLAPIDVAKAIARFAALKQAHARGDRTGTPEFFISSNQPPGPEVAASASGGAWRHLYPGAGDPPPGQPEPWPSLGAGLHWCIDRATALPLRTMSPTTLVWKLAAQMQAVASGELAMTAGAHLLNAADITSLLEQAAFQLHAFPSVPEPYRPYDTAPLLSGARISLIVGLSGSGKTSWAAELAQHESDSTVYFDAAALGDADIAPALLREIVAQIRLPSVADAPEIRSAGSGLEGLRAVDIVLHRQNRKVLIFIDNAQRVTAATLAATVKDRVALKWVLLAQPYAEVPVLETMLGAKTQQLAGWTLSSVASELRDTGASASTSDAQEVLQLTGGLPMFVKGLAQLVAREYGGVTSATCSAVRARTTATDLPQDIITGATFSALTLPAQLALAVLVDAGTRLARDWLVDVLHHVLGSGEGVLSAALKELVRCGAVNQSASKELWGHGSFLGTSVEWMLARPDLMRAARLRLVETLHSSKARQSSVALLGLYLRLLASTEQFETLADIVTSAPERVREYGLSRTLTESMERAAADPSLNNENRFWALDTLAFWNLSDRTARETLGIVERMGEILDPTSPRQVSSYHQKRMLLASEANDVEAVKIHYAAAISKASSDSLSLRILRYNYAATLYRLGDWQEAERQSAALANVYYRIVGVTQRELFAKNLDAVDALLKARRADYEEVKRLADTLYLYSLSRERRSESSTQEVISAHKLYAVTGYISSAVKAGQDAADQSLQITADPVFSRKLLETLLSMIQAYGLVDYLVPVRAHHAVLLAYCGDIAAARSTMREIAPFIPDLPQNHREDVVRQTALVEEIAAGRQRLKKRASPTDSLAVMFSGKIGRNDMCPCGSGNKYKKCHG